MIGGEIRGEGMEEEENDDDDEGRAGRIPLREG